MSPKKYHTPLLPDKYYHLYNRAIGNEKLFFANENFAYFLIKLKQHILPVTEVYAYSLLPNHFHLLVKIKQEAELIKHFEYKKKKQYNVINHDLPDFVMEQFSNFLNGYAKAINKRYNRSGALFIDYLKRSEAETDSDITSFIFYIHKNAVHHGLSKVIGQWKHDSYHTILSNQPTSLQREKVINWFGSREKFISFHKQPVDLKTADALNL